MRNSSSEIAPLSAALRGYCRNSRIDTTKGKSRKPDRTFGPTTINIFRAPSLSFTPRLVFSLQDG